MRVSGLLLTLCLTLPASSVACTTASDDGVGEDEAAHTAKEPVHANSPYFWAPTDYATFKRVAQAPPFRVGEPLGGDEPVTQRLQAWADRIHAEVSKDVKRKTGKALVAPKPIIVVVPAKEANAWVSGVPACITGRADLSALGPARADKTAALAFVEHDRVKEAFRMFGGPPPECATPDTWTDPDAVVDFFNTLGSRCKLTKDGDAVRVTGEGCDLQNASATAPTVASRLTIYAASPYVHFTTAMIALADNEEAIAGVVAHELGHYYRAHAIGELVMGKYNHWYEQRAVPDTKLPDAAPDNAALESRFREAIPYPMPRVEGQTLGYRITGLAIDELPAALADAGLCAEARDKLGEWRWDFGLGAFFVKKTTQEAYLEYERALLACAETVRITDGPAPGALSREKLDDAFSRGAGDLATPTVGGATLAEALRAINARALAAGAKADAFLAEVQSRRLGRYTVEQEADDFSVEYIARSGVTPIVRVDSYLGLVKARASEDPERFAANNGGMDAAACESLYRAGWRAPGSNELVVVPLGNLNEPHHGDCYRLFNMTQEIQAHRLRKSRTAPPSGATPWATVRAAAQQATDAFRPGGGPGGGGPFGGPQHAPQGGGPGGGVIIDGF